jgi:hypothetical protein
MQPCMRRATGHVAGRWLGGGGRWGSGRRLVAESEPGELGAGGDSELHVDVAEVVVDRSLGEEHLGGDLLVREPLGCIPDESFPAGPKPSPPRRRRVRGYLCQDPARGRPDLRCDTCDAARARRPPPQSSPFAAYAASIRVAAVSVGSSSSGLYMGKSRRRRSSSCVSAPASAAPSRATCRAARLFEFSASEPPSPTTISLFDIARH